VTLLRGLRARLLVANLVVAGAAIGTVFLGVSLIGPGYFQAVMGHGPGDPSGQAMDEATLAAFRQAIGAALLGAAITAILAAIAVSVALAIRIARPVTELAAAAERIAAGHYAERVPTSGGDEVADLADSFNQMSASLEATERRRLQLVGDIAHELRTPLTTLGGYLDGLEDGVVAPTTDTWKTLRREAMRLTRLVDDLQELWRAEARNLPLHLELIDLNQAIDDVIGPFRTGAQGRDVEVIVGRVSVRAWADRDRVAQILANFLSNALRYAPPGSQIHAGADRHGEEARLWVRDSGPGLTPDERIRVFERFFRLDPSRSRAEGGSGIGLAIVRALAEAMGGRAWAESAGPGTGSTFWIALPGEGTRKPHP